MKPLGASTVGGNPGISVQSQEWLPSERLPERSLFSTSATRHPPTTFESLAGLFAGHCGTHSQVTPGMEECRGQWSRDRRSKALA
jgi:hypothetical protein